MFNLNFIFSFFISLFNYNKTKQVIIPLMIIALALFAGTREEFVDPDYGVYIEMFTEGVKGFSNFKFFDGAEISAYIIPYVVNIFFKNYIEISVLLFAFIGVSTKIIALNRYSFFSLGIILYLSNLYIMQEMTTIRAGVSSGIFLLSIKDLEENNSKKFLLKIIVSLFFHYSSLLFLLIWFIITKKIDIKYYFLAIFLSLLVGISKINILTLFYLDRIFPKIKIYLYLLETYGEKNVNIFNFRIVIALLFLLFFIIFFKNYKENKTFQILIRVHMISLMIFFLMSGTAMVFSLRSFELISVIQLILYPMILVAFKQNSKIFGKLVIISIGIFQFYYLMYITDIYNDYSSWLI